MNYTFVNCYLPSGKTSTQTSQRIKAIKTPTALPPQIRLQNNYVIIAGDFNLVINPIDKTGHFTPKTNDKFYSKQYFLTLTLSTHTATYTFIPKLSLFFVPVLYPDSTVFIFLHPQYPK